MSNFIVMLCYFVLFCVHRSSLHRALHWGRLRAAAALLEVGASLALTDHRVRASLQISIVQLVVSKPLPTSSKSEVDSSQSSFN